MQRENDAEIFRYCRKIVDCHESINLGLWIAIHEDFDQERKGTGVTDTRSIGEGSREGEECCSGILL